MCNGAVFSMGTNVYSFGGVNVDIYLREVLEPEVLSCPYVTSLFFCEAVRGRRCVGEGEERGREGRGKERVCERVQEMEERKETYL